MKVPAFISNKVERNGDNCILTLTTKQAKIAAIVGSILIVAALVLGIWGIVRQAEVVQLRQQTQLQSEQLKLLQQKTEELKFGINKKNIDNPSLPIRNRKTTMMDFDEKINLNVNGKVGDKVNMVFHH